MMTIKTLALGVIAAGASLAMSAPASAEYTGPGAKGVAQSVAEVLKNPVDDQHVVLKGKLTHKVGSEKYTFSDGTGEIRVEIDNEDFPAVTVSDTTTIQITGEVEKDFMESPEIDVEALSVVQ